MLRREQPQTDRRRHRAACRPSRPPPCCEQLPAELATEALERMAWLDELSPAVLADLARELRQQLAPHR